MTEGKTRWTSTDGRHSVEVRGALVLFRLGKTKLRGITARAIDQHFMANEFQCHIIDKENGFELETRRTSGNDAFSLFSKSRRKLEDFHDKIIEAQNIGLMYLYRMGRGR